MVKRSGMIRSGGRTERIRQSVVSAVLDMLREGDIELSYQRLSELSGVHHSTIYRRWPDRYLLLQEAFSQRLTHLHVRPDPSITTYLFNLAKAYRDFLNDPLEMALSAVLAVSTEEEYSAFVNRSWSTVSNELKKPIEDAVKVGHLAKDTNELMLIRIIFGTISAEISFAKNIPSDDFLEMMINHLLRV